jgi:hypothetical protein
MVLTCNLACGAFQSLDMYFLCSYFARISASNALQTFFIKETKSTKNNSSQHNKHLL